MTYLDEKKPSPEEILHFGVKGMQWGVRRTKEQRTADRAVKRTAKQGKFEKKAAEYQKTINKLNDIKPKNPYHKRVISEKRVDLKQKQTRALDDAQRASKGKLTSRQKKIIVGGVVVGAIAAAAGVNSVVQSGEGNRLIMNGKEFLGKGGDFTKNVDLSRDYTPDALLQSVVKPINSNYGDMGTKQNCRRCTFAYEMRRRGSDVKATKTTTAHGQSLYGLLNATDPDMKPHKASGTTSAILRSVIDTSRGSKGKTSRAISLMESGGFGEHKVDWSDSGSAAHGIFDTLKKQPNKSRGEVGVGWLMGGGHSIAYEIVKGKPVIFDAQSGVMAKTPAQFEKAFGMVGSAGYTRLDNKKLDKEFLKRWVKNA